MRQRQDSVVQLSPLAKHKLIFTDAKQEEFIVSCAEKGCNFFERFEQTDLLTDDLLRGTEVVFVRRTKRLFGYQVDAAELFVFVELSDQEMIGVHLCQFEEDSLVPSFFEVGYFLPVFQHVCVGDGTDCFVEFAHSESCQVLCAGDDCFN